MPFFWSPDLDPEIAAIFAKSLKTNVYQALKYSQTFQKFVLSYLFGLKFLWLEHRLLLCTAQLSHHAQVTVLFHHFSNCLHYNSLNTKGQPARVTFMLRPQPSQITFLRIDSPIPSSMLSKSGATYTINAS